MIAFVEGIFIDVIFNIYTCKLLECNVFTGVCLSTGGRHLWFHVFSKVVGMSKGVGIFGERYPLPKYGTSVG